jgi:hypothetical protein
MWVRQAIRRCAGANCVTATTAGSLIWQQGLTAHIFEVSSRLKPFIYTPLQSFIDTGMQPDEM